MPVDSNVNECQVCNVKFTLITRRHWCRACLKTICAKCSSAFSQSNSLMSKLSRRHENNLCTLCQEATRFAIEERMLADAFKRHTERVPSNSGNNASARNGRQLFKDGEGAVGGPRRVGSATPKQRSTSASLVRPQQRRRSVSPMVMDGGFAGDDVTTTPPPGGFSAARKRVSSGASTSAATPQRVCAKSAFTPKRRVSFAGNLSSFVEPESPFQEASPSRDKEKKTEEIKHIDPAESSLANAVAVEEKPAVSPRPEQPAAGDQENCSPKKIRRSSSVLGSAANVKPILKSRSSNNVVRNM